MPNKAAAIKYLRASQRRRMKQAGADVARTTRAALEAIDDASDAPDSADWGDAAHPRRSQRVRPSTQQGVIHANTAARRKSRLLRQFHHARNPDAPTKCGSRRNAVPNGSPTPPTP